MAATIDPEGVALVEAVAAVITRSGYPPADAVLLRRIVLDRAPLDRIAADLGVSPDAVRVRWELLYGRLSRALAEADR